MYYDTERLQAMREMYEAGHSLEDVGEAFCTVPQAVWGIFKRNEIPLRPRSQNKGKCQNPERLKAMQRMHEAGMTLREIARLYHVTPPDISYLFRKHGVSRRKKNSSGMSA